MTKREEAKQKFVAAMFPAADFNVAKNNKMGKAICDAVDCMIDAAIEDIEYRLKQIPGFDVNPKQETDHRTFGKKRTPNVG